MINLINGETMDGVELVVHGRDTWIIPVIMMILIIIIYFSAIWKDIYDKNKKL